MTKAQIQAKEEQSQIQDKIEVVTNWLFNNTKHPDFLKKVSERNALLVDLETKRQQSLRSYWEMPQPVLYSVPNNI